MGDLSETYHQVAVKVNDGSGCLFQPVSSEYTYVLTAKHCIVPEKINCNRAKCIIDDCEINECKDKITKPIVISVWNNIMDKNELKEIARVSIGECFFFPQDNIISDVAVILINRIDKVPKITIYDGISRNENVTICGFPLVAKERPEPVIKDFIVTQTMGKSNFIINYNSATFSFNKSSYNNMSGFSGSGTFIESNDKLFLTGIYTELNDPQGVHGYRCFHVDKLNKILEWHNLPKLIPQSLTSFEFYITDALEKNRSEVRELLYSFSSNIISNFTPLEIISKYAKHLFLPFDDCFENNSMNGTLWKNWLIYLTFLHIAFNRVPDYGDIELGRARLFHTELEYIEDIIRKLYDKDVIDYLERKNYTILISNDKEPYDNFATYKDVKKILKDTFYVPLSSSGDNDDIQQQGKSFDIASVRGKRLRIYHVNYILRELNNTKYIFNNIQWSLKQVIRKYIK